MQPASVGGIAGPLLPYTAKSYQSDYDLLSIVSHEKLIDRATYWSRADERLIRERDRQRTE